MQAERIALINYTAPSGRVQHFAGDFLANGGVSRRPASGADVFQTLFRIILPLLTPSLATVGLFSIVGHWNEWFSGLIYMQNSNMYPLQTYLQTLIRDFEEILRMAQGDYALLLSMMNARTGRAAQLFLAALPVLAIYPFLQKYFTSGLVLGSVKG